MPKVTGPLFSLEAAGTFDDTITYQRYKGGTRVITKPGFACVADGSSLDLTKSSNSFSVLDSTARIAGTGTPGARGPGLGVDTGCAGAGSFTSGNCISRNGQLPVPGGGRVHLVCCLHAHLGKSLAAIPVNCNLLVHICVCARRRKSASIRRKAN